MPSIGATMPHVRHDRKLFRTEWSFVKMQADVDITVALNFCSSCRTQYPSDTDVCPLDGTKLVPLLQELLVGSLLNDRYKIEAIIGQGSTGVVYRACHKLIGRPVAIKMLNWRLVSDPRSIKRFEREARVTSRLNHPNVISVHDVGLSPRRQPYIVMDYAEGLPLSRLLKSRQKFGPERSIKMFLQICAALRHAHERGVVHRDLKPSNIMIASHDNRRDFVTVLDFSIAKLNCEQNAQSHSLTQPGEVIGTPAYMSPEQCMSQPLDARSDIYSLGVVMYQVLTGRPPLVGTTALDTMTRHVMEQPPSFKTAGLTNAGRALEEVVFRCLRKFPDDRYQSMEELSEDLEEIEAQFASSQCAPAPETGAAGGDGQSDSFSNLAPGGAPRVVPQGMLRPLPQRDAPNRASLTNSGNAPSESGSKAAERAKPSARKSSPGVATPAPGTLGLTAAFALSAAFALILAQGIWNPFPERSQAGDAQLSTLTPESDESFLSQRAVDAPVTIPAHPVNISHGKQEKNKRHSTAPGAVGKVRLSSSVTAVEPVKDSRSLQKSEHLFSRRPEQGPLPLKPYAQNDTPATLLPPGEHIENTGGLNNSPTRSDPLPADAVALNNHGVAAMNAHEYDAASRDFENALRINPHYGKAAANLCNTYNNWAAQMHESNRFVEAEAMYRRALLLREKMFGRNSRDLIPTLENYRSLLKAVGQEAEAASVAERIRALRSNDSDQEHSR